MIFGDWRRWLNKLSRKNQGRVAGPKRPPSARPRLEPLEGRALMAALFVDNLGDFTITADSGVAGLNNGDIVTWTPGTGSAHGGPVSGLIFGTSAFHTIQSAVNAAGAGDTIRVGSGTFAEKVNVSKQLTLLGNQFGVDARTRAGDPETVMDGTTNSGWTPFYVTANNVTLDGFAVQGATSGNVFGYGILLGAGTSGSQVLNNIIQDNIVGLGLANNSAARQTVVQNNLFRNNNNPGPASGNAIYSDQYVAGGALTNVLIDANRFEGHNDAALNLSSSVSRSQSAITFSNNDVVGNGRAAFLYNVVDSTLSNNTVRGSTFATSADFRMYGGVQNVTITGNLLSGGAGDAIRLTGSNNSGLLVQGNSIAGYAGDGLEIVSGGYTGSLDAASNWWGSASGPAVASNPGGTGKSIVDPSGQVDYSPWLTTGTDTDPLTPGFQGDFKQLTVIATSPRHTGQTTGNLQEAIDQVLAGGTVYVHTGTYVEQLEINKTLAVIEGVGHNAVIKSPASLALGFTTSASNKAVIYVHDADDVTLSGLTVDGDGQGNSNYRFVGIAYYDAGGTIDGVEVKNIMDRPFSGMQGGTGIYGYANNAASPHTLYVMDSIVHDYQKNGITMSGAGLTAYVTSNTVTGAGSTDKIAQNGIQFSLGATGTIEGNTVSGHRYAGASNATSSGILLSGVDHVTLTDNIVTDGQTGIYAYQADGLTIQGGEIREQTWAIILYGADGALVSGVKISNSSDLDNSMGVDVYQSADVTISDTTISGHAYGVYVEDGGSAAVNNNSITVNGTGIYVTNGGSLTSITENFVTGNSGDGILITATAGSVAPVFNNDLSGNGGLAVNNLSDTPVDATGNWWGTSTAADVADEIFGKVDFTPFLFSGLDTDIETTPGRGTYGFQGISTTPNLLQDADFDVDIQQDALNLNKQGAINVSFSVADTNDDNLDTAGILTYLAGLGASSFRLGSGTTENGWVKATSVTQNDGAFALSFASNPDWATELGNTPPSTLHLQVLVEGVWVELGEDTVRLFLAGKK